MWIPPTLLRVSGWPRIICSVLVFGGALGFLTGGFISSRRQDRLFSALESANRRLRADKLATELEARVAQLAQACLEDPVWGDVGLERVETPIQARALRNRFNEIRSRHPVARHFFLTEGAQVRFPFVRTPPRFMVESQLEGTFARLLLEAEELEMREDRPDLAQPLYGKCVRLDVPEPLKALALSRIGRVARKLGHHDDAARAYSALFHDFADLYDPSWRPYGLVAVSGSADARTLESRSRDLHNGRWEVSTEMFDYYAALFESKLGRSSAPTDFLDHLRAASQIERAFPHDGTLASIEVNPFVFGSEQGFYRERTHLPGPAMFTVISVDLNWVRYKLLPDLVHQSGIDSIVHVSSPGSAGTEETRVRFRALFPFWELILQPRRTRLPLPMRPEALFSVQAILAGLLAGGAWYLLLQRRHFDDLRGLFLESVAHDFVVPMERVRMWSARLADVAPLAEEERRDCAGRIQAEVEWFSHLSRRILTASRLKRDEPVLRLTPGRLADPIEKAAAMFRARSRRSLETLIDHEVPVVLYDSDEVVLTILELLRNAAKYSAPNGPMRLCLRAEEDGVVVEIEDGGPGKLHGDWKAGFGLGMVLARRAMKAHDGHLEVQREPGGGTRVRLVFPAARVHLSEAAGPDCDAGA